MTQLKKLPHIEQQKSKGQTKRKFEDSFKELERLPQ